MMARAQTGLVAAGLVALALAAGTAAGGFMTGVGVERVAHLADSQAGVNVTVLVNETFDGYRDNAFAFTLSGVPASPARGYRVEVAISADDPDLRAAWNATLSYPGGQTSLAGAVTIPRDSIQGTHPNTPFRFLLLADDGTVLDSVDTSIDVRYRTPPADGGLLQLALATTAFWVLVFLYALHLHSNERKLRARALALERALKGAGTDDPAAGPKR